MFIDSKAFVQTLSDADLKLLKSACWEETERRFNLKYEGCRPDTYQGYRLPFAMLHNLAYYKENKVMCVKWLRAYGHTKGIGNRQLSLEEAHDIVKFETEKYWRASGMP